MFWQMLVTYFFKNPGDDGESMVKLVMIEVSCTEERARNIIEEAKTEARTLK